MRGRRPPWFTADQVGPQLWTLQALNAVDCNTKIIHPKRVKKVHLSTDRMGDKLIGCEAIKLANTRKPLQRPRDQ